MLRSGRLVRGVKAMGSYYYKPITPQICNPRPMTKTEKNGIMIRKTHDKTNSNYSIYGMYPACGRSRPKLAALSE